MDTGKLFVVYRECDEERKSEAAIGVGGGGGGGSQRPVLSVTGPKKGTHVGPNTTSYCRVILVPGGLGVSKQIRNYCKCTKKTFQHIV